MFDNDKFYDKNVYEVVVQNYDKDKNATIHITYEVVADCITEAIEKIDESSAWEVISARFLKHIETVRQINRIVIPD